MYGERQVKVQHLEETASLTIAKGSDQATSEDDQSPVTLTANRLGQPPTEIRSQWLTSENLALFFDYRAKFRGIQWSDLDSFDGFDSESDDPYGYWSDGSGSSDQDPMEIDVDRDDEGFHDGDGSPRAGELVE